MSKELNLPGKMRCDGLQVKRYGLANPTPVKPDMSQESIIFSTKMKKYLAYICVISLVFTLLLLACGLYMYCMATQQVECQYKWVVLVAGSNGWYNYRHQADVAHAYHLLVARGIAPERIITFAYDDIAFNQENPFPGKIFNDYSHKDYYNGSVIDYRGKDVTPDMFIRVLKGDPSLKQKGRKVLESGSNDNVFIYYTDHGAPMLLSFPNDVIFASQLNETIAYMYNAKMYNKLVFYIEACESGSMFYRILPENMNVYATTAANPMEPSWSAFCSDPEIDTCLADEYSYNWMIDSEKHDLRKLTLKRQFKDVRKKTFGSHVQQYGNRTISKSHASEFQGSMNASVQINDYAATKDQIPSNQAHIHAMRKAVMRARSTEEQTMAKRKLMRAIKLGELAKETMDLIVETVSLSTSMKSLITASIDQEMTCYQQSYQVFKNRCFTIQRVPEVAQELIKLQNLCHIGVGTSDIVNAIEKICA